MAESKEKAFYYLKLSEGFFQDKVIRRLRRLPDGDSYVIIAIKLLLLGLQEDNHIFYDGVGDDFADEIALSIDEDPEATALVMNLMLSCGWLEQISDHELYSPKSAELVGSITSAGARMRRMRERKLEKESNEAEQANDNSAPETDSCECSAVPASQQSDDDVTHELQPVTPVLRQSDDDVTETLRPSDVEIELEIELERKKELTSVSKKESGKRFLAPSPETVQAYLDELGVKSFDGQGFCDHYESKGWMIGKNRMKDWKASVRTWMRQDRERGIDPLAEVSRQKGAGASMMQARGPAGLRDCDGQFDGDEPRRAD